MSTTHYLWDMVDDNVLCESYDGSNLDTISYHEPGRYGNLVCVRKSATTEFHHFDGAHSSREITDLTGAQIGERVYDTFGNIVYSGGSSSASCAYGDELGYYYDNEMDKSYVRTRFYDSVRGRWLSLDPLGYADGPNRYVYVRNNPGNLVDPSGLLTAELEEKLNRDHPERLNSQYYCGATHSEPFLDRMGIDKLKNISWHQRGGPVATLESLVAVYSSSRAPRCGKDVIVLSVMEMTSLVNGAPDPATFSLMRHMTFRFHPKTANGCNISFYPKYFIGTAKDALGMAIVAECVVPCDGAECQPLKSDHIIWAVDSFSKRNQTRPGQMVLWQWRVCPKTLCDCYFRVCDASTHVTQAEYGWAWDALNPLDPTKLEDDYQNPPPWAIRPNPEAVLPGQEPTPISPRVIGIGSIVKEHAKNGGSVVQDPCPS